MMISGCCQELGHTSVAIAGQVNGYLTTNALRGSDHEGYRFDWLKGSHGKTTESYALLVLFPEKLPAPFGDSNL